MSCKLCLRGRQGTWQECKKSDSLRLHIHGENITLLIYLHPTPLLSRVGVMTRMRRWGSGSPRELQNTGTKSNEVLSPSTCLSQMIVRYCTTNLAFASRKQPRPPLCPPGVHSFRYLASAERHGGFQLVLDDAQHSRNPVLTSYCQREKHRPAQQNRCRPCCRHGRPECVQRRGTH